MEFDVCGLHFQLNALELKYSGPSMLQIQLCDTKNKQSRAQDAKVMELYLRNTKQPIIQYMSLVLISLFNQKPFSFSPETIYSLN